MSFQTLLNYSCSFLCDMQKRFLVKVTSTSLPVGCKMLLQVLLLVFTFCAHLDAYYDVNVENIEPWLQTEARYKHWHLGKIHPTDYGLFNYEMCKAECYHPRISYRLWVEDEKEDCPPHITEVQLPKVLLLEPPKYDHENVCKHKVRLIYLSKSQTTKTFCPILV